MAKPRGRPPRFCFPINYQDTLSAATKDQAIT
jgi:hypothetical protein